MFWVPLICWVLVNALTLCLWIKFDKDWLIVLIAVVWGLSTSLAIIHYDL